METYEYIGNDPFLVGHTSLGMVNHGQFVVQVDNINHPWATGWHKAELTDWLPK